MKSEILEINGLSFPVKIHFEKRNNSRVSIGGSAINIRIPSFLNIKEKNIQINKMKKWAKNNIMENPEKFKSYKQKIYKTGDIVEINQEKFTLIIKYKNKKNSSAKLIGSTIKLLISDNLSKEKKNNHISSLISRCIAQKRLPILKEKIQKLNRKYFDQDINEIFFKNNKSNWGSCSNIGNINISTRLLFVPDDILEYICIHELAHLVEHNHSKKFWTLVEKAMPNYKEKEKWLKNYGNLCRF